MSMYPGNTWRSLRRLSPAKNSSSIRWACGRAKNSSLVRIVPVVHKCSPASSFMTSTVIPSVSMSYGVWVTPATTPMRQGSSSNHTWKGGPIGLRNWMGWSFCMLVSLC
jgi:hypothetical protein